MTLELHPLCTLFPRIAGSEFDALKADIAANGLRQPIVTHKGFILDGGNRYSACTALGIKPDTVEFNGGNLVSYVLSVNLHRRHLSPGQQAAIVASATDWGRAQVHGGDRKSDQAEALPLETVANRAAVSGATERTQRDADKLVKEYPDLAKEVTQGRKSLYSAVKETKPAQIEHDDVPDMTQLADDLQKENEAYQRQIKSLEADDANAELVRLNTHLDQLNGRLQGEITTRNEAQKMVKHYADLLAKIRKALNVENNRDILAALGQK